MKRFIKLSALLLFIICIGCAEQNCNDQMTDVRNDYGSAEETYGYDSGEYHTIDWWYWSNGFEYTFTWGGSAGGCQVSKYTFTPILKPSAGFKDVIRQSKVLVEQFICPGTLMPTQ